MVALGARFYLKERLRRRQWAGVAASMAGVLLVITRGSWRAVAHLELLPGDFILLVSQAGWSAYTIYGKQVLAVHSPAVATTAAYILGSVMLLPMPLRGRAASSPAPTSPRRPRGGSCSTRRILGAIAHVWWYEGGQGGGPEPRRDLHEPAAGGGRGAGVGDAARGGRVAGDRGRRRSCCWACALTTQAPPRPRPRPAS